MKQLICTISFIKEHTALQIGDPPGQLLKHSDTTKLISCIFFKMLHLQLDEIFKFRKDLETVDVKILALLQKDSIRMDAKLDDMPFKKC